MWDVHWFQTDEREMYPIRLVEYLQSFKCGHFFPRWCPDLCGGYGYPLFNYYQPGLFATAAAIMALLAVTPVAGLKLAVTAYAIAGGYGVYRLIFGETGRSDAALLGAIVFIYSPYRLSQLFVRGDLSEFAAYSLVPFVLWGYRELNRAEPSRTPLIGTATALAHAATLFCHVLIGLYTTEIVGAMLLLEVFWHRENMLRRAVLGSVVVILAIALAAIYLGPAWFEGRLVRLENLRYGNWYAPNNLIFPWRLIFQSGLRSVGLASAVGIVAAAMSFVLPKVRQNASSVIGWWLPVIVILSLTLKSGWTRWFWIWFPLASFIQFPWRLLGFVGLFASVGIGVSWTLIVSERWRAFRWLGAISLALGVAYIEQPYRCFTHGGIDVPDTLTTPAGILAQPTDHARYGLYTTVFANEYLPVTVRQPRLLPSNVKLVIGAGKAATKVTQPCPLRYLVEAQAELPSALDLQVFNFPGWKAATLSGPAEAHLLSSNEGLIRLYLPQPGDYRIEVYFGMTTVRVVASAITLLALLLIYPILWELNRLLLFRERPLPPA